MDILDLLAGALYSLNRAVELGFTDRPGDLKPNYRENLAKRLRRMFVGQPPQSGLWLAGMHFNSALFRVAAAYRRCQDAFKRAERRQGTPHPVLFETHDLTEIRDECNRLKHDFEGILAGRKAAVARTIKAVNELIRELQKQQNLLG